MAVFTQINDPSAYFKVQLYTGDGSANHAITFDDTDTDMQPDLVWIKNRDAADSHCLFDSVRGATKLLSSNTGTAESTDTDTLDSFTSDGFQVDADVKVNTNAENYVSWNWKESATAGFDIVSYTGTGSTHTQSHSLSAVPHMIIFKNREATDWWVVYHHKLTAPADRCLFLNSTYAEFDEDTGGETLWNDTVPTSSVFTVGDYEGLNTNTEDQITYLWTAKQGFSKFGGYTGNGNDDGAFIYTGFKPAFVIVKQTSGTNLQAWWMQDSARNPFNVVNQHLRADQTNADSSSYDLMDFVSNGFKTRWDDTALNGSGVSYIYMAFAEAPFVNSNGVPCNAR